MNQNDGQRLATVWNRFAGDLRRFFRRHAPDAVAEDLLQDTFVKLSGSLASLRHEERLAAWVQRVARNVLVDHRREQRPQPTELDPPAPEPEPDAARELSGCLRSFVAALPPRYREAVRLVELENLPREEVARRLELSPSGLKSRLQRGRERLRAMLITCCELEFDRRGGLTSYQRRRAGDCRGGTGQNCSLPQPKGSR